MPELAPAPANSTAQASVEVLLEHSGLVGRPGPVAAGRALVPPTAREAAQARLGAPGWGVPGREALGLKVPQRVVLRLGMSGRRLRGGRCRGGRCRGGRRRGGGRWGGRRPCGG